MADGARSPVETAKELNVIFQKRSRLSIHDMIFLSILAGVYIGFGAIAATSVKANAELASAAAVRTGVALGDVVSTGRMALRVPLRAEYGPSLGVLLGPRWRSAGVWHR